jgi:hypothetical protein
MYSGKRRVSGRINGYLRQTYKSLKRRARQTSKDSETNNRKS